jgi:ABC-2 type transport system permease protein
MNRYWIVARHELITQLRRKSFLFFAFVFPLLMIGANIGISYVVANQVEETGTLGTVGYVDQAGLLAPALERPDEFQPYRDLDSAAAALADGNIGAYFVVPPDYMSSGRVDAFTYQSVPAGIEEQFSDFVRANLLADRDPLVAERLQQPADITMATLDGSRELTQESAFGLIMTPIIFAIVFSMSITMTSSFLMQNVAEEKETRMVELMMTSITPLQMLWGKILGLGALGLVQVTGWALAGGAIYLASGSGRDLLSSLNLSPWMLALAALYLLLGYLLYGSLLAGIGASSSSLQEAQTISSVSALIAMSPIFAFMSFLQNANGPLPLALSLIPFTSPMAMMMRVSLGTVPLWQIGFSMALLAAGAAVVVWLAAWIFRVGLLMTGKRLGLRTLFRLIRRGADQAVPVMNHLGGGTR